MREGLELDVGRNPELGPDLHPAQSHPVLPADVHRDDPVLPYRRLAPSVVRQWHRQALRGPGGLTSTAQSYRFLRAVLSVAVADEAIDRNPCRINGAGTVKLAERPVATPTEVAALIEAITPRYRAAVVLVAWCGLRRGEVCGLHTKDVDLATGTVWVERAWAELLESDVKFEMDPKSAEVLGFDNFIAGIAGRAAYIKAM